MQTPAAVKRANDALRRCLAAVAAAIPAPRAERVARAREGLLRLVAASRSETGGRLEGGEGLAGEDDADGKDDQGAEQGHDLEKAAGDGETGGEAR